jgi:hypothetical protein
MGDQFRHQSPGSLDEIRQRLAFGPLQREEVQPALLAVVEGLDDPLVLDAGPVLGLPEEPLSGVLVGAESWLEDLEK